MLPRLPNPHLRQLKALAQRLEPLAKIGKQGLSEAFLRALDELLSQHELVKVKFDEHKDQRKTWAPLLAEKTSSHLVMLVGHVAVLYRPQQDPKRRKIALGAVARESDSLPRPRP